MGKPRVGILALQGDFDAHHQALCEAGACPVLVRTAGQLEQVEALIIPGGESTTMLKLLREERMFEPLREFGEQRPIFGTCAGAILLAREVRHPEQESLGLMDIVVERNAYGRQVMSRVARVEPEPPFLAANGDGGAHGDGGMEAVFIRAPIIRRVGEGVRVLARYEGDPVVVEQGRHLAATYHPELTADRRLHQYFLARL